jgi:hypothetical protein
MTDTFTDDEIIERHAQIARNALFDFMYEYLGSEAARLTQKAMKKEGYRKLGEKDKLYYPNVTLELKRTLEHMVKWMDEIDEEN